MKYENKVDKDTKYSQPKFEGITCQLELGNWEIGSINKLLKEAEEKSYGCQNEKLSYIIQKFLGTPFYFESNLPILADDTLRVRLKDFDCITFIYYMLALAKSLDFQEFVKNLYLIRYLNTDNNRLSNDPDKGNIFDFTCDSILKNALEKSLLFDVTSDIIDKRHLQNLSVDLKRFKRPKAFDENELYVTPKYGERTVTASFITADNIEKANFNNLQSGDIALFSRGPFNKEGGKSSLLIGHFAFIHKENNDVFFIHSTRNYTRKTDFSSKYTGIFYDENRKLEQLGVSYGGIFQGNESKIQSGVDQYWGYDQSIKRPLLDYFLDNFWGIMFLRIC